MLGLARGLNKVLNYEEPNATHEASMIGYHCDLKPANILVRESGTLLISDFGQATFKKVAGTNSSNVFGVGGTEAYAPPEIDNTELRLNRKYDIWSLGCILVEVYVFVVSGSAGVRQLDCARLTAIPGKRNIDDRFFRHNSMSNSYELKPEVMHLIRELPHLVQDSLERDFLNEILLVALQMLDVEVQSRWTSMQVCINLARILDRFQSIPLAEPVLPNLSVQSPCSGVEIGKELTERLQSINYNVKGFWDSGPVRFTQVGMLLLIQVWDREAWTENSLGQRSQLRLVLRYALRNPPSHYNSDAHLYLSPGRVGQFSTNNSADRMLLQEILLGFEVGKSMKLKAAQVELKHRKLMPKKFQRKGSGESGGRKYDLEVDASCIQLWKESSYGDITSMVSPALSSRRQSPRALRVGSPPRRIVIFFKQSVLVIRLAKNFRIQPPDPAGRAATSLDLVLTDGSRDPSFPVSVFKEKSKEPLPSFPLHREVFEAEEAENMVECSSLTLNFHSVGDAESFYRTYKKIKHGWAEDLKKFESVQKRIGPEFGYALS
jgi:Protein kinase domain